mmetsp:Transcript_26956/g.45193  ORF Transcript_26956/g.45193 Transcript_26956/m.45193 type:complete len:221 (-) Transcript_26956:274-936(-)
MKLMVALRAAMRTSKMTVLCMDTPSTWWRVARWLCSTGASTGASWPKMRSALSRCRSFGDCTLWNMKGISSAQPPDSKMFVAISPTVSHTFLRMPLSVSSCRQASSSALMPAWVASGRIGQTVSPVSSWASLVSIFLKSTAHMARELTLEDFRRTCVSCVAHCVGCFLHSLYTASAWSRSSFTVDMSVVIIISNGAGFATSSMVEAACIAATSAIVSALF